MIWSTRLDKQKSCIVFVEKEEKSTTKERVVELSNLSNRKVKWFATLN